MRNRAIGGGTVKWSFTIKRHHLEALRDLSAREGISMAAIIDRFIERGLEETRRLRAAS